MFIITDELPLTYWIMIAMYILKNVRFTSTLSAKINVITSTEFSSTFRRLTSPVSSLLSLVRIRRYMHSKLNPWLALAVPEINSGLTPCLVLIPKMLRKGYFMPKAMKICRVCGKEYEYCHTARRVPRCIPVAGRCLLAGMWREISCRNSVRLVLTMS